MARPERYSYSLPGTASRERQRGYLMVVSMLIILLITIMSISMAKSFFQEEGMAGNLREKSRSFAAAQTGLRYAEWIAYQNGQTVGSTCAANTVLTAATVCNSGAAFGATYAVTPLTTYFAIANPGTTVATFLNGTTTAGTGSDAFYALPGAYIYNEGALVGGGAVYQITAFGYGSTVNSISVVQSTYEVTCSTQNVAPGQSPC